MCPQHQGMQDALNIILDWFLIHYFFIGQPCRDPTNPDYVPSVFCHRPIKEGVLQEKVQRHKRLVERKENIARSESAQALLTLSMDKPEKCAGTATQTPVVHIVIPKCKVISRSL